MKGKLKRSALMVMLASLSASGMAAAESPAAKATTTSTVAVMSIPAYTLITDSLNSLVPRVNGKVNEPVMRLVCDMARGDRVRADIIRALENSKVNVAAVPVQGSPLSVLVHGDTRLQQSVCASYLATSLFDTPDNARYRGVKKEQVSEEKLLPAPAKWKVWEEQKTETVTTERQTVSWDTTKFAEDVKVQVALAKATAQLYALLATNLGTQPQTAAMVDARVKQSLADLAGDYLNSVQQMYRDTQAQTMTVNLLNETGYAVSDGTGNVLRRSDTGLRLTYRGIEWLGNGKILGKDHFVNLSLRDIPVAVAEPVVEEKPPVKGRRK
ncbi:hypothetical protein N6A11_005451 [Klebsiella oxytoca]|uniref:hypothetical protein n=1 Tax=Klebsiella oxytoca TaxID=571 RepID=UPI001F456027|nr:hypothetical protein [Klebsiella oxytoca]EJV1073387.1 hypothetical protein [Klebsiella oxytoca]MCE5399846.1 hypothetical protein [Klebsiella oxytoca]